MARWGEEDNKEVSIRGACVRWLLDDGRRLGETHRFCTSDKSDNTRALSSPSYLRMTAYVSCEMLMDFRPSPLILCN